MTEINITQFLAAARSYFFELLPAQAALNSQPSRSIH